MELAADLKIGGGGGGGGVTDHALLTDLDYASAGHTGFTPSSRMISTTSPLTGGGDLSSDRTIGINVSLIDHGSLTGLSDDDHTQYILVSGARAFTAPVGGVDPVYGYQLATKSYVDSLLHGTQYQPTTLTVVVGTLLSGNVASLYYVDSNVADIKEVTGTPGFDVIVDFTGVTKIADIHIAAEYLGGAGHTVQIQVWNWITASWDVYAAMVDEPYEQFYSLDLVTPDNYLGTGGDAGKVRARFYHTNSGIPSHHLYLNYVAVVTESYGVTDHSALTNLDYAHAGHTGFVSTARTISTTAPLSGGGDLSADRTLSIPAATSSQDGYLKKEDWTIFNGKGTVAPVKLSGNTTYYVRTDGNDSNDGSANDAAHAWLTVGHAVSWIIGNINLNGYNITIQIADGTYSGLVQILDDPPGNGTVYVQGNSGAYNNVILDNSGANSYTVYAKGSSKFQFRYMKVQNTGSSGDRQGFYADTLSVLTISEINFGTTTNGPMVASDNGKILVTGAVGIGSNSVTLFYSKLGGKLVVSGATFTLTGTPAFSLATAYCIAQGLILFYGTTFTGSATGKRYQGETLGLIDTLGSGSTYLPGNSAGSVATGAIYN